jgi:hypothetical protein
VIELNGGSSSPTPPRPSGDPIWIGRALAVHGGEDDEEEALEVNTEPTLEA